MELRILRREMEPLPRVRESFLRRGAESRSTSLSWDGRAKKPYLCSQYSSPFVTKARVNDLPVNVGEGLQFARIEVALLFGPVCNLIGLRHVQACPRALNAVFISVAFDP